MTTPIAWQRRRAPLATRRAPITAPTANVTIDGVTVHELTMEGVHFRTSSSYGVLKHWRIFDTGQDGRGMGEGVYVGSVNSYSDTRPTMSRFSTTSSARWSAARTSPSRATATSSRNVGTGTTKSGFQTHQQSPGWGCGTTFRNNSSNLTGAVGPYAIEVTVYDAATCPVTVTSDNTVVGGDGLVNPGIPVSPVGGGPGPEPSPTPEPTPSPTPSPSPSATTPACTAPAWSAGAVYTGGATVSHAGSTYTAGWWTQGETPGTSQWGAWAVVGPC